MARNAAATQRRTIAAFRQRQTRRVRIHTPAWGLSMIWVVARHRCNEGGTPSRFSVKHSFRPSRKLAAAPEYCRSSHCASFSSYPIPASAPASRPLAAVPTASDCCYAFDPQSDSFSSRRFSFRRIAQPDSTESGREPPPLNFQLRLGYPRPTGVYYQPPEDQKVNSGSMHCEKEGSCLTTKRRDMHNS